MPPSGGTTTTTSTQNVNTGPWSVQAPFLQSGFNNAYHLLQTDPLTPFSGSTVAPMNSAQTQGYNDIIGMGLAGSPLTPAANQTALDTITGKYLDPSTNPYLAATFKAAAAPVAQTFQNITAPTTDALFSANGRYGSGARYNAQNNNTFNLGQTLDTLGTEIYGGNYQNERQNQVAQTNNTGNVIQAGYLAPTAAINAGGALQGQAQNELTGRISQDQAAKLDPWITGQLYQGLVNGNYGTSGTITGTQQTPYSSNPMGSILGGVMGLGGTAAQLGWSPFGAAAGAGAAGAAGGLGGIAGAMGLGGAAGVNAASLPFLLGAFSDVRLKEDIQPVGKTYDGQNLYAYRYKGDPTPHVGLMAQEVEKIKPDAVFEHPSGYKMVDYGKALGWGALG